MVDNQHQRIVGYRDLTEDEIALMNECKEAAQRVGELVDKVQALPISPIPPGSFTSHDPRWAAMAKTQLQIGFMLLIRSIAKPTTF